MNCAFLGSEAFNQGEMMVLRDFLACMLAVCICAFSLAADTVHVNVGDDLAALVDTNPEGAVFFVHKGLYRGIGGIQLKPKQQIIGELDDSGKRAVILSGAKLLENWTKEGEYWVHDVGDIGITIAGNMYKGFANVCNDLYFDGIIMRQVITKADLDTFVWNTDIWPIGAYEQFAEIKEMKEAGELTHVIWWLDIANLKAHIKDDPRGHTMEISDKGSLGFGRNGQGCVVKNIIAEKYAGRWQGSIMGFRIQADSTTPCNTLKGALIENCEARFGHAGGISFHGCAPGFIMRNCYAHHNGHIGVKLVHTKGAIVEGCEIAYNCLERTIGFVPSENGGTKFAARNDSTIIRYNYVHHNWDNGIWFDGDNSHSTVEGNVAEKNTGAGIFIEVSDPESQWMKVKYNIARRNGYCGWFYAGQVQISVTNRVDISHNVLEVDWVQGGHALAIIYQIGDGGRRLRPPHHTVFKNNDVTWNKPNICPGQDVVPWQPTVAGNTKHGWGCSVWAKSIGGTDADVPDSMKAKRLVSYDAQRTCVDTCGIRLDSNSYHCEGGMEETEQYKYWRWPPSYPDTNDYDNDGTIDYDYDMTAYSLKGIQDSLDLERGSTVDNVIDTNIAGQLQKLLNMGAPESTVEKMGKHFDLTLPDIQAYITIRHNGQAAYRSASVRLPAIYAGGMLKLRLGTSGIYNVALYNARGRQIAKHVYEMQSERMVKPVLDMRNLPAGIYSLRIIGHNARQVQKIAHCM
jgi:hypothetical protein